MDEKFLEIADAYATRLIESGIEQSRVQNKKPLNFSGGCACGEIIPPARISYGFYNCTECQSAIERRGKNLRK